MRYILLIGAVVITALVSSSGLRASADCFLHTIAHTPGAFSCFNPK